MAVLVIAEHDNQVLKTSTLNTITAAQKINNEIHLIILGKDIEVLANTSKSIHTLSKVLKCDNEELENFLPEILAPIIAKISTSYSHILAPASTFGKNLLPRMSALLDTTQVSDIIGIENENTFIRPIYAGNAISHVQTNQEINLLTIRPSSFEKCEDSGGEAAIEEIPFVDSEAKTLFISKAFYTICHICRSPSYTTSLIIICY